MFTLADTPVKFIGLLLMFAFCTVWCIVELTRRQEARQYVSNGLHLAMAIIMLLMVPKSVWMPFRSVFPIEWSTGLMALGTIWFVYLALRATGHRGHFIGHTLMFAAMTWHLAGMMVKMPHHGPDMQAWMMEASRPGGSLWWVALVGLPLMAYLLYASVRELRAAIRPLGGHGGGHGVESAKAAIAHDHAGAQAPTDAATGTVATAVRARTAPRAEDTQPTHAEGCHATGSARVERLAAISGFCMNFGMFWMSTGLLVPLLPWMRLLAF